MRVTLLIHIAAGSLAIVSGFVAVFAAKGGRLHRRAGVVFVGSMVTMGLFGAGMAAVDADLGNVVAGLLAAYLVVTALTTVRPPTASSRWLDRGALLVALAVGATNLALGLDSLARGDSTRNGVPVAAFLVFGAVALLSGAGDLRMMRAGGYRGPRRLARHLWRMCFALFVASGSFFLGQADELPASLRIFPLLAIPAFLPLVLMVYWLWRVRARKPVREVARVRSPEPALPTLAGTLSS